MLRGVNDDHRAIIDDAQPYRRNQGDQMPVLEALRDLSNYDKHRLIHAALVAPDFGPDDPLPFEANEDAGEPEGPPKLAPFVESEEVDVFVQEYTCPGPNPDVRITGPLVVGIGFGDEALDMPLRVRALAAMEQEVLRLIDAFADDFP